MICQGFYLIFAILAPLQTGTRTHQDGDLNPGSVEEPLNDLADCSFNLVKNERDPKHQKSRKVGKDGYERDVTIRLLRKEIECALESLKEVQDEMARLHEEKKQMLASEKQSHQSIKCLTTQLLALQVSMSDFEVLSKSKIEALSDKFKELEKTLKEDCCHWYQRKEVIYLYNKLNSHCETSVLVFLFLPYSSIQ